jgi:hypothetical protein
VSDETANVRGVAENEGGCRVCDLTFIAERLTPCRRDGVPELWNLVEEWLGELAVPIGSGPTERSCKSVVAVRCGQS